MKSIGRNHRRDVLEYKELSDEYLIGWYKSYNPDGNSPSSVMMVLCALIEEIAETRGIELPKRNT